MQRLRNQPNNDSYLSLYLRIIVWQTTMGVQELVRRNSVRRGAVSDEDPKELFREATASFVLAVADALAALCGGEAAEQAGVHFETLWMKHLRGRSKEYLMRALQDDDLRQRAVQVFKAARSVWQGSSCVIPPPQVLLLLMKDERAVHGRQSYYEELDRHVEVCRSCAARCARLRAGMAALKRGFQIWFDSPSRFPQAARTLGQIERRGYSTADLITYMYVRRRLDSVADLATSPDCVEAQAYKLVGWAKDAGQAERRARHYLATDAERADGHWAADLGLQVGSRELADRVSHLSEAIRSRQSKLKNPGDRLLLNLVWEVLRLLFVSSEMPEPEQVSISDILRAVAHVFALPEITKEVEHALGYPSGRWRWNAIRWTIVAWCAQPLSMADFLSDAKRSAKGGVLVAAVGGAVARRRVTRQLSLLDWVADSERRIQLERRGREDREFGAAAKRLRDMYEEALKRVTEVDGRQPGCSLSEPETLAALFNVVEADGPHLPHSGGVGPPEKRADGTDSSGRDVEVRGLAEGLCVEGT